MVIVLSGTAWGAPTPAAAESAKRAFDIPAGTAETALRSFAEQADTQFVYSADKVKGVRTNALRGNYTPREALDRLVSDTELSVVQDARTGALTVDRNRPRAIPQNSPTPQNAAKMKTHKQAHKTLFSWLAALFVATSSASVSAQEATSAPLPTAENSAIAQANVVKDQAKGEEETIRLPSFSVTASKDSGYFAANSVSATRIEMPINDLPFSVSALTYQFIQDTGFINLQDTASFAAGVKAADIEFNFGATSFMIRGFGQYPQHDGVFESANGNLYVDPITIERVEVVKGPASLLYGQISPGGTVNYITKRAEDKAFATVSLSGSAYSLMRTTVDINQPLVPGVLLFRFNGVWSNDYKVETNGKSRTIVLSPTSTWKIAKNLSFTVNVQTFMRRETPEETQLPFIAIGTPQSIVNAFDPARGYPIPGSAVAGKIGLSLSPYGSIDVDQGYNDGSDAWLNGTFLFPRNFSYASDHDYRITDLGSIESELDLNLGEHWRARANFDYNYFGQHQYLTGYGGVFIAPPNTLLYTNGAWSLAPGYAALTSAQQLQVAANFLTALVNNPQSAESQLQNGMSPPLVQPRRIRLWDVYGHDNTVQVEAAGTYKFRWGDFKPLLGAYTNQNYIVNLIHQTNGTAAFPYAHPWDVNPSSPTYYIDPTAPAIPNAVPFYVAQYGLAYSSNQAAYALLNFDFFKHRFFVITGARYNQASERTTNYLGTTPLAVYGQGLRTHYTTPQAGIGYKLTPDLMLYASYSTSFTLPTATYITGVGYDATGAPIPLPLKAAKPTIGEGYEVGLKTNFLGGRIASTLSAYQVTQNDVFTSSTGVFTGPTGISNSVLVSFQGSTLRSRGIEYEVTFSPLDNWQVFASVTDMDCRYTAEPIGYLYFLGQAPLYVSRYLGNLWTRYTFVRGPKGLWIGGGLKYMSRHVDEGGNYFVDPANTDVEAAIGYEWQWGKVKYTLTANGMNLANQLLLSTENAISIPRRVVVKLSATF